MNARPPKDREPTKSVQIPISFAVWRRLQFIAARLRTPMGQLLAPYVAVGLAELETRVEVEAEEADAR